ILFGQGASVNVGGLVASTRNITDSHFLAGNYQFAGSGAGSVVNQGSLNADGGYVALLGATVSNDDVISAQSGSVALAAGNAMTLDLAGDGLVNVAVTEDAVNALVQNGGLIRADGGQVLLTTQVAGSLLQNAVNNTGVIQAQTLVTEKSGRIKLMGGMSTGTVNVGGTLDASAPNGGDGGFIETSAAHVYLAQDVQVTSAAANGLNGTFLIDPQDFTVGSAIGDNITGAVLGALLVTNSVTISTAIGTDAVVAGTPPVSSLFSPTLGNGDIFITEAVVWTATPSPTTLTLNAARDVNIGRNSAGTVITTATIKPTNGNVVVCCGRDINVEAAITVATPGGSVLLSAGNNVNLNAAITVTSGNITMCAANNLNLGLAAAITLTDFATSPALSLGLANGLVLSAGTNGTGVGSVNFAAGTPPIAVTRAPVNIYYNPLSYTTPTDYSTATFFTLVGPGSPLTEYMLVFPNASKSYDGTTTATLAGLKGAPAGVALTGAGTATYDTKDVGINKTVSFTGYSLTQTAPITTGGTAINFALATSCCAPVVSKTTGTITQAALTVTALDQTKVYGTAFPFTGLPAEFTSTGLQNGETIGSATLTSTGTPTTAKVTVPQATGYPISISNALPGTFTPSNYLINYFPGTLTVTPKPLVGNITAANKVYDTNNTATIVTRTLNPGVLGADDVSYSGGTATFSDKNVADGKTVTGIGLGLSGADAGNYTVNPTDTTTANITPIALVGNITAANKVYDTNNTATIVTRTLNPGVLGAEDVSYSGGTATFSDKNAADGKTVTGIGLGLSGADAGNYTVNPTDTTTANITPIALVGNITAANKVYDTNNTATIVTRTLNPGVLGAEDVSYSGGTATFDTPAAGVGKPVTG
ncbi:MAG: YDG domain-containing protein, partial [Rhodoferax sp.]|nr:YDG domain-containing protein [Rhodoferax sp.]